MKNIYDITIGRLFANNKLLKTFLRLIVDFINFFTPDGLF